MNKLLYFVLLAFIAGSISCSKDKSENELPVPEGTKSVVIKDNQAWELECPGFGNVGYFEMSNSYGKNYLNAAKGEWRFTSLGNTQGLSNVTEIPSGEWNGEEIVEGHSYVGKVVYGGMEGKKNTVSVVYVRFVIEKVVQENGKVIEMHCKYQAPFNGTADKFVVAGGGGDKHFDIRENGQTIQVEPRQCFKVIYPNSFCVLRSIVPTGTYADIGGLSATSTTSPLGINLAPLDTLVFSNGKNEPQTVTLTTNKTIIWDDTDEGVYKYLLSETITSSKLEAIWGEYHIQQYMIYNPPVIPVNEVSIKLANNYHNELKAILSLYYGSSKEVCKITLKKRRN